MNSILHQTRELSRNGWAVWGLALIAAWLFSQLTVDLLPWAHQYPRGWIWPIRFEITAFMKWLVNDATFGLFTFKELTRSVSWLLDWPLTAATSLFSTGLMKGQGSDAVQLTPPLAWLAVLGVLAAMGHYARDWKLAALVGGCFLYLAVFGQWDSAMITLSSIVVAVPIGVAGGLMLGILAYRSPWFEKAIRPVLDLMQTVPIFAYLVPILFLFGFGPVAAMTATIIYAMPPMVRVTVLALRQVADEIVDFGRMVGCTRRQMTWKVLVPAAMPSLMVGVNQVIMLSLNMVIIASMIGAGGLGFDVLSALRRLDIGAGLEAGIAIVVLAIALDRLSQAFAARPPPQHHDQTQGWVRRHPWLAFSILWIALTGIAGLLLEPVQAYPETLEVTTASFWGELVKYINVTFFDYLEGIKTFFLLNLLIPFKRFLLDIPWAVIVALAGLAGWRLGGWKLALPALSLSLLIAVTGQWEKAMITVYLCGISVVIASLIGIPIGIRVGDFAAMIAVVAYALAPAIRYTAHGIRQIDANLVEAGVAAGCTRRQVLWKIKLPLALPEIMLGINQTIMLALSMLVITALVGTRDLGQEVYIALTKADTGRGIVAGLSVAFIAIIADRLIAAGSGHMRRRLGLAEEGGER